MSKLEELIQKYCPDGVEYVQIGDVAQVGTGSSNGNEAEENGEYPFFVRSQTIKRKNDYEYDEEAIIIPGEGGIGDIFHYINGKYALHQRVYRIHFITPSVNVKFAYYYMRSAFKQFIMMKAVSATVTSIRKPMIEGFTLPVPPLPVQEEIVRVLDTFTELQAELQAELQKRLQQYYYYRDNLLSFEGREDVEWKKLGEMCSVLRGKRLTKSQLSPDGRYKVFHGGIEPIGFFDQYNRVGSTTMVINVGASAGTVGFSKDMFWSSDGCFCLSQSPIISGRFLYYCLQTKEPYLMSRVRRAGIPTLDGKVLEELTIPVPSLTEQQKIIDILDRFDALTNDITAGLPAEIEKRRQQYEYYRDKLLTFKRKEA